LINVASHLPRIAEKAPSRIAVVYPKGRDASGRLNYAQMTFQQLDQESDRYAHGLAKLGIGRQCKVLLMVPPGIEFITLSFALLKIGAVMILLDPGIGKDHLLDCIREVEPEAMIAVPLVHLLSLVHRNHFKRLQHRITVGRRWLWNGATLGAVREENWRKFPPADLTGEDPAAIVFTTGSTGAPKGVLYLHGMFDAQIRILQSQFNIREEEIGFPAFSPFALFCVAMGTTCVLPLMDPTKPAQVNPREMLQPIQDYAVTYSFGSPAFWNRVSQYCVEHGIQLPSVKKVIMAGAPVSATVLSQLEAILSKDANSYTPYGATEALPVTSISGAEILHETARLTRQGKGTCVGAAAHNIELKIIPISDEPIAQWNEALALPQGEIGEIVVKGEIVSAGYYHREDQTALARIPDGRSFWHRMGDVGYLDTKGRLWFCGRKGHRVITEKKTLFTVPCEAIFNQHQDVFRSALVGVGPKTSQRPVVIVEPRERKMPANRQAEIKFTEELLDLGRQNELTRDIKDILFHPSFPVDFRHNAKIIREQLAAWAKGKIG
jgi:acyl-CoA synthetase (AMP-forming)/AMP-acid ligase II